MYIVYCFLFQLIIISHQTAKVTNVFEKFNFAQLVKPVRDKMEEFNDLLAVLYHSNIGGINYLNPSYLWEKFKEKKDEHLLLPTGEHNHNTMHDYPSAYRNSKH